MGAPTDNDARPLHANRPTRTVGAQQELPRRPRSLPATLWACVPWVGVNLLGCGLAVANQQAGWFNPNAGVALYMLASFLCSIGAARGMRLAVLKALVPPQGMICPRCHFPLPKELNEGVCPECGTRYDRASVVRLWRTRYKLDKHLPSDEELAGLPKPPP